MHSLRSPFPLLGAMVVAACSGDGGADSGTPTPTPTNPAFERPACYTDTVPTSASAYAAMVEPHLGVVPTVDAADMIEIPLFRNGERVYGVFEPDEVDNPSRLAGRATVSGSALQRYPGVSADGETLPDVVWVALRRLANLDPANLAGTVQLIGHNTVTGATAFIESAAGGDNLQPWLTAVEGKGGRITIIGTMPGVGDPDFDDAYEFSRDVQCVSCHQADPFVSNTFVNAARRPFTGDPVIPLLRGTAPYYVLGGGDWDMRTLEVDGNACLSCHRIGMTTITQSFEPTGYDVNQYMPPSAPGAFADAYQELLDAWTAGPENVEGAQWVIPPACGDEGDNQPVGADYPYAQAFNAP